MGLHLGVLRIYFYTGKPILDDLSPLSKPPSESISILRNGAGLFSTGHDYIYTPHVV